MANQPSFESIYTYTAAMPAFETETKAFKATSIRLPIFVQIYLCKTTKDVFKAQKRIVEVYKLLRVQGDKTVNGIKYPNMSVAICAYLITHDLAQYKISLSEILDDEPTGMVVVD